MKKTILFIVIAVCLCGCNNIDKNTLKNEIKSELLDELKQPNINDQLVSVTDEISSVTVGISVNLGESTTFGSGIIIDKKDNTYFVLTNEHVQRYHEAIEIYLPTIDRYFDGIVVKENQELDLALITFSTTSELNVYTIEETECHLGEIVLAVGSSTSLDYANTITMGIISKIDDNTIQHDAAINNGNSGGPLFNINGKLIGINYSKINTTYSGTNKVYVEGMGFAILMDDVSTFLEE